MFLSLVHAFLNLSGAVFALYLLKYLLLAVKPSRLPLPPGPPGLPIIKNLLDWPTSKEWETFTRWGQIYGDISHLSLLGKNMIIINSYDIAMELYHNRGAMYSGRGSAVTATQMAGQHRFLSVMEGPAWKEYRRMFVQHIGSHGALARFEPTMYAHTRQFLRQIVDDPNPGKLHRYIQTMTGSVILDVTYGYKAKGSQDHLIQISEQVMNDVSEIQRPATVIVDLMPSMAPILSLLPAFKMLKEAPTMLKRMMDFATIPYKFTQDHLHEDSVQHSLVANHLQNMEHSDSEEEKLIWTAAIMYAGGGDTSVSSIYYFYLFMTLNPDVQAKAQAEIDKVVGPNRLPNLSDRKNLPYVTALVSEVFRCGIVTPGALPHKLDRDDTYNGYFFPKGSLVAPNIWGMARDPRRYPNPEVFDPTRFMGDKPQLDPRNIAFGFGRRICPGRAFVEQTVFLLCSMTLATLNITKSVDADGNVITPSIEPEGGLLMHPKEYVCTIKPRSAQAEALLRSGVHE